MKQIVGYIFEEKYYCLDCKTEGKHIYDTDEAPKNGISCSECGDDILEPDEGYCKFERFIARGLSRETEWRDVFDNEYDEWDIGGDTYKVLTDKEADEECESYIENSLFAFQHSFLSQHSKCIASLPDKAFNVLQEQCEDVNEVFKDMIDDWGVFVEDAISSDGRGYFLSHYDGEEHELGEFEGETYYAYRTD